MRKNSGNQVGHTRPPGDCGNNKKRLCILISGRGSNMQAIHQGCLSGALDATVASVISNNADAVGLRYAEQQGISTTIVDHRDFCDRLAFDQALAAEIDRCNPALIALAGFMRVLSAEFTNRYLGRLINIHPSLLPRHKGLNTHHKALACGDRWHGCSVHFVSATLDGGPLIARSIVPVLPTDTEESLSARVLTSEHKLYTTIISKCLRGDYVRSGNAVACQGTPLRYPPTY